MMYTRPIPLMVDTFKVNKHFTIEDPEVHVRVCMHAHTRVFVIPSSSPLAPGQVMRMRMRMHMHTTHTIQKLHTYTRTRTLAGPRPRVAGGKDRWQALSIDEQCTGCPSARGHVCTDGARGRTVTWLFTAPKEVGRTATGLIDEGLETVWRGVAVCFFYYLCVCVCVCVPSCEVRGPEL